MISSMQTSIFRRVSARRVVPDEVDGVLGRIGLERRKKKKLVDGLAGNVWVAWLEYSLKWLLTFDWLVCDARFPHFARSVSRPSFLFSKVSTSNPRNHPKWLSLHRRPHRIPFRSILMLPSAGWRTSLPSPPLTSASTPWTTVLSFPLRIASSKVRIVFPLLRILWHDQRSIHLFALTVLGNGNDLRHTSTKQHWNLAYLRPS